MFGNKLWETSKQETTSNVKCPKALGFLAFWVVHKISNIAIIRCPNQLKFGMVVSIMNK